MGWSAVWGGVTGTSAGRAPPNTPYEAWGGPTSPCTDQAGTVARITEHYAGLQQDELDGLTVSSPDGWWFNVRASNTEPLLRLNVEGPDEATMGRVRDEVLDLIRAN